MEALKRNFARPPKKASQMAGLFAGLFAGLLVGMLAVSYTHLTLPTIYSV